MMALDPRYLGRQATQEWRWVGPAGINSGVSDGDAHWPLTNERLPYTATEKMQEKYRCQHIRTSSFEFDF